MKTKRNEHVNEIFQPFLNSLSPGIEKDEVECPECGCVRILETKDKYFCRLCWNTWDNIKTT